MTLSKFTPSNHKPQLLEELLVGRRRLLDTIGARIGAAAASAERNHTLLVGGRGAGKTFLVTLAHARAEQLRLDGAKIETSWPLEDLYWVTTYGEFLAEIAKTLSTPLDGALATGWESLEAQLAAHANSHGPIVVFVENLDQIFATLGKAGQQRLRRFCQDDAALLLVATTTAITDDLAEQAAPFYGFFTTSTLDPFSIGEAADMLTKIASRNNDPELAEFLGTDEAKGRLQAIAHLAGSQPRIWAMLAEGLTVRGLRNLLQLLLTQLDNLTPYYQEQLGRLSPQQRRVINQLIKAEHPLHVAEIAERLDNDQRSIAKTLSELRDRNWITQTQSPLLRFADKRRNYYELAEPLARIALQVKAARGDEPIKVIVEFCKIWFAPADITQSALTDTYQAAILNTDGQTEISLAHTVSGLPAHATPAVEHLGRLDDVLTDLAHGNSDSAIALHHSLRAAIETRIAHNDDPTAPEVLEEISRQINDLAIDQFGETPHADMDAWIDRAEQRLGRTQAPADTARVAQWYARTWNFDSAHAIAETLAGAKNRKRSKKLTDPEHAYYEARQWLGQSYRHAGQYADAVNELSTLADTLSARTDRTNPLLLAVEIDLATALRHNNQVNEAIRLLTRIVDDCETALGPHDDKTVRGRVALAAAHWSNGRPDRAIPIFQEAIEHETLQSGSNSRDVLRLTSSLGAAYLQSGESETALEILEEATARAKKAFGPHERVVLLLRNNLAAVFWETGDNQKALQEFTELHATQAKNLGEHHPEVLSIKINLATAIWVDGNHKRAKRTLKEVVTDATITLGNEHDITEKAAFGLHRMNADTFHRIAPS